MTRRVIIACAVALVASGARIEAQSPDTTTQPIQDNSFLVEEAYNQDPGVVQHISQAQFTSLGRWAYTFTQEWPVPGLTHQLSYTIPVLRGAGRYDGVRIGDVALNYRYQLVGGGDTRVAVAPRLTIMFPTGDYNLGTGAGGPTVQTNVPLSFVATPTFVMHSNVGFTMSKRTNIDVVPGFGGAKITGRTSTWNVGQSFIWIARPLFNVMLESVATHAAEDGTTTNTAIVSPGVRWGYDFPSKLQVVPGIALPFTFTSGARTTTGMILYLSFEHPFTEAARQ